MLAQGLVRRKLFPGSDCLKFIDREIGLSAELLAHRWDIGCFQEVDRTDSHFQTLQRAGFAYAYEKGYEKKLHGLMIAWRTRPRRIDWTLESQGEQQRQQCTTQSVTFEKEPIAIKTILLDDLEVMPFLDATSQARRRGQSEGAEARHQNETKTKARNRACSRQTRNVALFVALRFRSDSGSAGAGQEDQASDERGAEREGIIVATTHLFWHPMHVYERVRQAGLIQRHLQLFRESRPEWRKWQVILAGGAFSFPISFPFLSRVHSFFRARFLTKMGKKRKLTTLLC